MQRKFLVDVEEEVPDRHGQASFASNRGAKNVSNGGTFSFRLFGTPI
jgi:hypothetical protein